MSRWFLWIACAAPLLAQTASAPVVLLNGYQATCGAASDSSATFGSMQALLQAAGWQVYFFDNCSVDGGITGSGRPNIEDLAQAFGSFLANLGVPQVDVVAHSMGGLIVRAWLAGMQPQGGFSPPTDTLIRKAVFIATPHTGALAIAGLIGGNVTDPQAIEMFPGSDFLWNLDTWNQRMDDLRGVDALSLAGNLGESANAPHSNDGVISLTSASLAATLGPQRVRVLPYCHEDNLPSLLCIGPGIADITGPDHPTYQIVTSFLSGDNAWQTIGSDATADPVLSHYGGLLVGVYDNSGNPVPNPGTAVVMNAPLAGDLALNTEGVFFADYVPAGQFQLGVDGSIYPLPVAASGHTALEMKPGPQIALIEPAAANLPVLTRAPGMLIAIYGSDLDGASVTIGGIACPILYESSGQINSVIPAGLQGLVHVSVSSAMGQDAVNLLPAPAVPALFSADGSGTGPALAIHASDSSPVSASSPAQPGESISIFLTGLGVPAQQPVLQAGGAAVSVIGISGLANGVVQLNFTAPQPLAGASSVSLQAFAGNFSSNVVTLNVAQQRLPSRRSQGSE